MIEVRNISKSFNGKQILQHVDGKFERGQVNLIIGASGTGKSVLLKCIVGLIQPDIGEIYYNGRHFSHNSENIKIDIRREIGMLFQGGALFDSKSVEENVTFPLNILSDMSHKEKVDRVNFCLERVGLKQANKKMPSELSGGMKKRVGIARAIVNNPNYLLCDEPNSGLDPQTSILIDQLIHDITKEFNTTTVVVTHDMNSVLGIGEEILFLYQGKNLWQGARSEIMHANIQELDNFIFSNKMIRVLKKSKFI